MRIFLIIAITLTSLFFVSCNKNKVNPHTKKSNPLSQDSDENETNPPLKFNGTVDGAGGGDYYEQLFWALADEIKFRLKYVSTADPLTEEQITKVKNLIDKEIVDLSFPKRPLHIVIDKKEFEVSAINVKARNGNKAKIFINFDQLKNFFSSTLEVRSLILHEFLGLADIDDTNYSVSSHYFPPNKYPVLQNYISFFCRYEGQAIVLKNQDFHLKKLMIFFNPDLANFEESQKEFLKKLTAKFNLPNKNKSVFNTKYNLKPGEYKTATLTIPIVIDEEQLESKYFLRITVKILSGQNDIGFGAFHNKRTFSPGKIIVVSELLLQTASGFLLVGANKKKINLIHNIYGCNWY